MKSTDTFNRKISFTLKLYTAIRRYHRLVAKKKLQLQTTQYMDVCMHSKTSEFWVKIKYINTDCQYGTLTGTWWNCMFPIPRPKIIVFSSEIVYVMLRITKKWYLNTNENTKYIWNSLSFHFSFCVPCFCFHVFLLISFAYLNHYPASPKFQFSTNAFRGSFNKGLTHALALIKPHFHNTSKNKNPLISPFWKPVKTKGFLQE